MIDCPIGIVLSVEKLYMSVEGPVPVRVIGEPPAMVRLASSELVKAERTS